ncbi:MAG: nucleoid-associated protein [Armatimonadota bacterium]|nr:MAG: nucleoid-associated protein [Armatimonadota bacterium]
MARGFGNLGGFGDLMKQAQKMAEDAQRLEEELAAERVEATSGGGMVRAVVTGKGELLDISIDPQVVDPEDVEMLEDLVVTAVREALEKVQEMRAERVKDLTGGLGLPQGLNIPGL